MRNRQSTYRVLQCRQYLTAAANPGISDPEALKAIENA
jgi:hypothetical protein